MADAVSTVSISQAYFDALLRRDLFQHEITVTISRDEHNVLVKSAVEYQLLRTALINGGVSAENLDLLISGAAATNSSPPPQYEPVDNSDSPIKPVRQTWSAKAVPFISKARPEPALLLETEFQDKVDAPFATDLSPTDYWTAPNSASSKSEELRNHSLYPFEEHEGVQECIQDYHQQDEENNCYENDHDARQVALRGISPHTTLADVLNVIRGEPLAAEKFLMYSRRCDIYIQGKRIEASWDDHQHYLAAHIARRVRNGASRNLIIRFVKPEMTEESIREDLDHVYRLEIVSIRFEEPHAIVSLNSIGLAVHAKSCLASRFKYKGTRIDFYVDDCSQTLPPIVKGPRPDRSQQILKDKKSGYNFKNRFQMLTVDDEEQGQNNYRPENMSGLP